MMDAPLLSIRPSDKTTRILGLWPMQLITVPNICPVAVVAVVVVARAFVDEVDFMEILCRTRRWMKNGVN